MADKSDDVAKKLVGQLAVKFWRVRVAAAQLLTKMKAAAIPELLKALKDRSSRSQFVREAAAHALGAMGPEAHASVKALIKVLGDSSRGARRAAADALVAIGEAAAPELRKVIINPDSDAYMSTRAKKIVAAIEKQK